MLAVRATRSEDELAAALALRERVFCGEQGVPPEAERDGRDAGALHLVALEEGRVIGTCRLLLEGDEARLGRMAVEGEGRRRGVGAALLAAADRHAAEHGARRLTLHSQLGARSVYARAGYEPRGEPFVEQGIDHVTMEKALA